MSDRRTVSQTMFTDYLFKQVNYLPVSLTGFQPLIRSIRTLCKILYHHGNLGAGERWKKTISSQGGEGFHGSLLIQECMC